MSRQSARDRAAFGDAGQRGAMQLRASVDLDFWAATDPRQEAASFKDRNFLERMEQLGSTPPIGCV